MIHSAKFIAVLDTNVVYPIEIRDLLFWFAHFELFTPKWSKHIFDEWRRIMKEKGINDNEISKRVSNAERAFPDAFVTNYDNLIEALALPDKNDRHVMAAAIKTNANVIVTNNLKDYPNDYLQSFGLTAKKPDDFLTDIIDLNHKIAMDAFQRMVMNRQSPNLDEFQVLDRLRNTGLSDTANYLHSLL